jgi:hypothetical protein
MIKEWGVIGRMRITMKEMIILNKKVFIMMILMQTAMKTP